jgi:hypothetical protein
MARHVWNLVLEFYGGDPAIAWMLTFAFICLIAAVVVAARAQYQERRRRQADADFRRRMTAALGPINYPPAKGPKGFERQRICARAGCGLPESDHGLTARHAAQHVFVRRQAS